MVSGRERTDRPGSGEGDGPGAVSTPEPRGRRWIAGRYWLLGGALLAIGLATQGSLDERAQAATDRVFRQALVTYAAARSLDAAVSLAEGTEIALEPGGVGVTVSAGEILEPLDDLIEQVSTVLLVSATSLGIQSLLLRASAWGVLTLLLVAILVARVGAAFFPERVHPSVRQTVSTLAGVLLLARLAMPLYALGTALIFERFLEPRQTEAVQALEAAGEDVRTLHRLDEEGTRRGLIGRVSDWFSETVERLDASERVEAFRERVSQVVDHLLHLLVVFVLQTILLPLAFLWVLGRLSAGVLRGGRS